VPDLNDLRQKSKRKETTSNLKETNAKLWKEKSWP